MVMRPSSLQQRVTWAMTGTLAVFLMVMSLLAYAVFDRMEDDLVDNVLTAQVDALRAGLAQGQTLQALLPVRAVDGERIQAWLMPAGHAGPPAGVTLPARDAHDVQEGGHTWHVWVESVPQGTLYVRYDASAHEARVRLFGWLLLAGASLTLLCAWWFARRLARRVVAPIRQVSERLSAWGQAGATVPVAPGADEAAQLIQAFNQLQDRIDRAMAVERRFAANLSHELRTPLAALRSDCEMALLDAAADSPLAARLQRMMAQVDAAASSLSGAVALQQADAARVREVDVAHMLEQAWFALRPAAQARGLVLDNRIPAGVQQRLDPDALLIVLRNLLRNAVEHAAPATLVVGQDAAGALVFEDDGPGLAAGQLAEWQDWRSGRADLAAPGGSVAAQVGHGERGEHGGHGERGLGLGIARQVCELQGWRLSVASSGRTTPGWTRFTLVFALDPRDSVRPGPGG